VSWLGKSELANALNSGLDPHLDFAAFLLGIPYAEAQRHKKCADIVAARQTGKIVNFGFPGGLGTMSLVKYAKKNYGVVLTQAQAKELKEQWLKKWPEMRLYFARIHALCNTESGKATIETLWTKRTRGRMSYCVACNYGFQALGADCAKHAAWLIAKAQYVEEHSPLYNTRTVAFVHDEFIVEAPDNDRAHDVACELARLMVEGANVYLPDVPIPLSKMEPTLMRRWSKRAEPKFSVEGRLIPWTA